jgi:hypothetical protein
VGTAFCNFPNEARARPMPSQIPNRGASLRPIEIASPESVLGRSRGRIRLAARRFTGRMDRALDRAKAAVTNARFTTLYGLPVGPFSLSTTPVVLRKPRARHERQSRLSRKSGGLPSAAVVLRPRCAMRFSRSPLHFLARRPQTEADMYSSRAANLWRHLIRRLVPEAWNRPI